MIPVDRWGPSDGLVLEPNALAAAKEVTRNLALTAGPGAGKTEMLAQRADFLLRTGICRYPRRILAISFKVDAARNLKARVRRRCGPELAARLDSHTFHAFGKRLIDHFRLALKGPDALDPDYTVGDRRVQNKSITFKEMVPLGLEIISSNTVARNAVRQTYSHVFLDEFQDCTAEQYELIKACFGGTSTVLTAVGDTKQSIMGWAGALEGIFQTFAAEFDAASLNLYQNFRSAPRLRRMQNAMVRVMDPPAAVADADIAGEGGCIEEMVFDTDDDEAVAISGLVQRLINDEGISASEIAVLVSKQQALYCRSLTAAFDAAGTPYREEDASQDLASEPVARLIVDFLLVTSGAGQAAARRRLLELVIFNQGFDEEREYQQRSRWNRLINETRAGIAIGEVDVSRADHLAALTASLIEAVGRAHLVSLSAEYAHSGRLDQLIADTLTRVGDLLQWGVDVPTALSAFSGDSGVRIMSIHKSKGLEFEAVFILGVEDQTFWGDLTAERSAYFVGISRAKERLYLTVCKRRKRPEGAYRWSEARTPHDEFLSYAR